VEELRKSLGWADRVLEPRKVPRLLTELADTGEPALVRELLPLSFGTGPEVASIVRLAIARLVMPHLPELLPELDEWLRHPGPGLKGPSAWHVLETDTIAKLPFDSDPDIVFVGLCASHWNGRVREAAVARLSSAHGGAELPFLLWRANDWVAPVAMRARTAVVARITDGYAASFVRCLGLVARLALAKRNDLRDLGTSIEDLLLSAGGRQALADGMHSSNQRIRRRCWELCKERWKDVPIDVAEAATHGGDPVVRRLAYEAMLRIAEGDRRDRIMDAALHDASAAIRSMALDCWIRSTSPLASEMIQASLFDRAPELRARARFVWRQRTGLEADPLYREALPTARGSRLIGTIYGIGETGTSSDVALIREYVRHSRALVRMAAIRAGWRLDRTAMQPLLIDALLHDTPAVAREARLCLERVLPSLDQDELWRQAPPGAAARRLLTMFRQLGKWDRLLYILRALSADDPDTMAFARGELASWNDGFNKTYLPLPTVDRDRLLVLATRAAATDGRDDLMRTVRFTLEHS
jgi:hypothetical protein